jgi:hypothetical protein
MAHRPLQFELFVVSVDFDTHVRPYQRAYYQLRKLLPTLGGVLPVTHQIRLLVTPLSARQIRNRIRHQILRSRSDDRAYIGKIAKGSAWFNLLRINNTTLKQILLVWAQGRSPTRDQVRAARQALRGLLP